MLDPPSIVTRRNRSLRWLRRNAGGRTHLGLSLTWLNGERLRHRRYWWTGLTEAEEGGWPNIGVQCTFLLQHLLEQIPHPRKINQSRQPLELFQKNLCGHSASQSAGSGHTVHKAAHCRATGGPPEWPLAGTGSLLGSSWVWSFCRIRCISVEPRCTLILTLSKTKAAKFTVLDDNREHRNKELDQTMTRQWDALTCRLEYTTIDETKCKHLQQITSEGKRGTDHKEEQD